LGDLAGWLTPYERFWRGRLTALGGHLAWGWSAAEAMRELGGVRAQLIGTVKPPQRAANRS